MTTADSRRAHCAARRVASIRSATFYELRVGRGPTGVVSLLGRQQLKFTFQLQNQRIIRSITEFQFHAESFHVAQMSWHVIFSNECVSIDAGLVFASIKISKLFDMEQVKGYSNGPDRAPPSGSVIQHREEMAQRTDGDKTMPNGMRIAQPGIQYKKYDPGGIGKAASQQ